MHLAALTVHEPTELEEAFRFLRELGPRTRLLAGGTDLLVDLKTGRAAADHLISLRRIAALRGIERVAPDEHGCTGPVGLRIGALTTIAELEHSPLLGGPFEVIREAAREMAAPQVRNAATIGGNLASAVPCADLPPVLGVLDAAVLLRAAAPPHRLRTVRLTDFFSGPRQTVRTEDEILTAVVVPAPPPPPSRFGAAYARLALRDGNAIAVASVAVSIWLDDDGVIDGIRMVLGAVAPSPKFMTEGKGGGGGSDSLIRARVPDSIENAVALAMAAAEPISDLRASAGYRREMVGVLTRRAITTAHARAEGAKPAPPQEALS